MQRLVIQRSSLHGTLIVPPSKSQTMRALLFASLAEGESTLLSPLDSPDVEAMVAACRALGATIVQKGKDLSVRGVGGRVRLQAKEIDAGNSGLVFRFITAVAALDCQWVRITGDASICSNRVIRPLLNALQQLGAEVCYHDEEGRAPFSIRGPISPGKAALSGEDSQPVSALLIAAAFMPGTTELFVRNPGEKPWVSMTLSWLRRWGIVVKNRDFSQYRIEGGLTIPSFSYSVPGDFSAAAFPVVASLLTPSKLRIQPLDWEEPQGDKLLFRALESMGAQFSYLHPKQEVVIEGSQDLRGCSLAVNEMIDAVPILGVVAAHAQGRTTVTQAAIARRKECDRIASLVQELSLMGAKMDEMADGFSVTPHPLRGAPVSSHGDHRLAMALAVAGMTAEGTTVIEGVECIQKSFPDFIPTMQRLGAKFSLL